MSPIPCEIWLGTMDNRRGFNAPQITKLSLLLFLFCTYYYDIINMTVLFVIGNLQ